MRPLFITRAGRLTRYALACGYIERVRRDDDLEVTLERVSDFFRVTLSYPAEWHRVGARQTFEWESRSLREARADFDRNARTQAPAELKAYRAALIAERARLEAENAL